MKRKVPPGRGFNVAARDILDLDEKILIGIGAVSLAWNNLEQGINFAVPVVLCIEFEDWLQVTSRINGFDGKIAIIKHAAKSFSHIKPKAYLALCETLNRIEEYKKYRDGVIHANITDPSSPVAPTHAQRGAEFETLITPEALLALYNHIQCVAAELNEIIGVFVEASINRRDRGRTANSEQPNEARIQSYVARLQSNQNRRNALPPLPRFPDEP